METVNWNISRMHCHGSTARLQKVISGKDGVQSATVSYAETSIIGIWFRNNIAGTTAGHDWKGGVWNYILL